MDRVAHAQRHHYPYGMGPRLRGRTTRGRGRGTALCPSFIPPVRYPYDAGVHFLTPMVVRSGVVTAWPRPQLPVVQPTEDVMPVPPAAVQGAAIKNTPLQKSHYFPNKLIFFGEIFRGYS